MSLDQTVRKAKAELSFTNDAFAGLEAAMMAEMFATSADQSIKREKLFFAIKSIRAVHNALERAVTDGEAIVNYQTILAESGLSSPLP